MLPGGGWRAEGLTIRPSIESIRVSLVRVRHGGRRSPPPCQEQIASALLDSNQDTVGDANRPSGSRSGIAIDADPLEVDLCTCNGVIRYPTVRDEQRCGG